MMGTIGVSSNIHGFIDYIDIDIDSSIGVSLSSQQC